MKQIPIGTCIPGSAVFDWGKPLVDAGYECLSINYHMQCDQPDLKAFAEQVKAVLSETEAHIATIGFYCNALESKEQRSTLEAFIDHAKYFNVSHVSTFAGALEGQPVDRAMPVFKEVFGELAKRAEANGVKLLFENCPMGGTWQRATCNIAFNPRAWEMIFNEVPSDALGLEWEPAHQMLQLIEPMPQLKKWIQRIHHVHGKDATLDKHAVSEWGILDPKEFCYSRTPGFGDTNWRDIFFTLYQNGYEGVISVEGYHDPIFCREFEMTGQLHALRYLKWCRGGDFTANPWQ